jgi:hypothetical protein
MLPACGAGGDEGEPLVPDGGGEPIKGTCDGVEAVLGTGSRIFEPVEDGDTIYLFRGPQGGYMVMLSVRAKGLDRQSLTVDYTEHLVDRDELVGVGTWRVQLPNDLGGGWYERVGIWGEIEPEWWTRSSQIRGHVLRVKVKLSDDRGCSVDGLGWTVNIHPEPPPN